MGESTTKKEFDKLTKLSDKYQYEKEGWELPWKYEVLKPKQGMDDFKFLIIFELEIPE